jgi:hypothetical protein
MTCLTMDSSMPSGICTNPAIAPHDGIDGVVRPTCFQHIIKLAISPDMGWCQHSGETVESKGQNEVQCRCGQAWRTHECTIDRAVIIPLHVGARL